MKAVRSRARRRARREAGFTLVEVLVSLVLLALVLALLAGASRFATSTWDATARLDRGAGHDVAGAFLRARLAEAMPLFERTEAGTVKVAFTGGTDALSFVAPAPNGPSGAGLYQFSVRTARAGGDERTPKTLYVSATPYQPQARRTSPEARAQGSVLIDDVATLTLRYFGRQPLRAAPAWHPQWSRTDALPELVELTIAHDDRRSMATTVVQLRLRGQAN